MMVKTFGKVVRFALVLAFLPPTATNLWSKAPRTKTMDAQERPRVTISVYNIAEVPADVLERAENEASQVFRLAGIEVTWLNCRIPAVSEDASRACREAVFPGHLHLRIVRKSLGLNAETMGISFQADDGSGCYADLFYEPMEQLHQSDGIDLASLLGHVATHEIGHLLLGTNSHSAAGIMHARWTAEELASARVGGLAFLEKESRRMKARLATALRVSAPMRVQASVQASKEGPSATAAEVPARTDD